MSLADELDRLESQYRSGAITKGQYYQARANATAEVQESHATALSSADSVSTAPGVMLDYQVMSSARVAAAVRRYPLGSFRRLAVAYMYAAPLAVILSLADDLIGIATVGEIAVASYDFSSKAGLVALVSYVISHIASGILIYRCWAQIQDGHARTTPGKAIGYLYIPLYNLYWVYTAIAGLAADMHAYLASRRPLDNVPEPRLAQNTCTWFVLSWLSVILWVLFDRLLVRGELSFEAWTFARLCCYAVSITSTYLWLSVAWNFAMVSEEIAILSVQPQTAQPTSDTVTSAAAPVHIPKSIFLKHPAVIFLLVVSAKIFIMWLIRNLR